MSNETQPEIRFPGFTEDWEERKVFEISKVTYGGGTPKTNTKEFWNGNIPWIQSSDLEINRLFNVSPKKKITSEAVKKSAAKIIPPNSIAIVTRVGVGKLALMPFEYATSQDFLSLSELQIDSYFGIFSLYSMLQKELKNIQGTSIKGMTKSDLLEKKVTIPKKYEEQQKIGNFFKQLDDTITLHQRKLDLLKETKKGFLQKMFPKNGAKVPEIRFPGFTGDWEQRKLGDAADIVGGGTPSTANPEYWDGDIDWYAPAEIGEQIYVSKSQRTITELGQQKSSAKILPVGTVLFTSRAGIGNTAILAKEATTNQGFQSIVPHKDKLDSYFIFSRTNELKRYGEVTGAGSTFVEVSGKQMAKMPLLIPSIAEQRQIGSFFKQLDNTITLHQRKLDLLKETKKGFLQKMFV
ncbi:restriction endonuclease subunit S [Enterococcus faecium]|uniref:restriction endonuclease subunit S n=1 Tax=Enterococcus faecium TaxID=1352 RepID=UPI000F4FC1D9|nr:restriction endonuclease subunit S [Enterococcus faecium]ROX74277.1 restriction endonuclease subunit S [Enterococcus faecium]